MNCRRRIDGFSLLELTVVLVVIGLLLSVVSFAYTGVLKSSEKQKTQAVLQDIQQSLLIFAVTNHRLPCADVDGNGYEGSGAPGVCGTATLSKAGFLPYKTLFLDSEPLDAEHQRFRYGVYRNATVNADLAVRAERTGDAVGSERYQGLGDLLKGLSLANVSAPLATEVYVTGDAVHTGIPTCIKNVVANPAYVLVAGGHEDLDGVNGYWDAPNGLFSVGKYCIASPSYAETAIYDDVVVAESFAGLRGKLLQLSSGL